MGPGLGRDLALRFAAAGADVTLSSRRRDVADAVAGEVEALGCRASVVPADVTVAADVEALFAAVSGLGRLDTVVYNAFAPPTMTEIVDIPDETWAHSFEVNVLGAARVARAAVALLGASGGSIVFVNTQAARRSEPRRGQYAATKSAQLSLARTLAGELGPLGIRVNSVVPGRIMGPALQSFLAARAERRHTTVEALLADATRNVALRRIPSGTEVADAAVFFASSLAAAVTGQTLDVNGGDWWG